MTSTFARWCRKSSTISRLKSIWRAVDPAADLREALDIDSMDFLNFITAIHHRLGVDIPELDYPKLITLDGAVAYIAAKLASVKK